MAAQMRVDADTAEPNLTTEMNLDASQRRSDGQAARCGFDRVWRVLCAALLLASAGCKTAHRNAHGSERTDVAAATQPPLFLTGPCSVLLTNAEQFSARIVMSTGVGALENPPLYAGNLFHQFGQLLFVPMKDGSLAPGAQKKSFRFLWDVSRNSGYVICEALRGYARASAPARYSWVAASADFGPLTIEKAEGQECERQETSVRSNDGTTCRLTVWRATELNGVPVRMTWGSGSETFALRLSEVVVEAQTPELFEPPGAFSEYATAESMVSELVRRPHPLPYSHGNDGRQR